MGMAVDITTQCRCAGLPVPEPEHEFALCIGRHWRLDHAWVDFRVALEVEGGTRIKGGGRHNRHAGFTEDCEKYSWASILGWCLVRATTEMVADGRALALVREALASRERKS